MRKTFATILLVILLGFLVFASTKIVLATDGPCAPEEPVPEPVPPKEGS